MRIKVSDFVAKFLSQNVAKHAFAITGGASLHLMHSIDETDGITLICPQHEQAGAFAADGYARVTKGMGIAIATSGPGATNLLTGVCSSYYDSIPVMYITGQVATFRSKGNLGVRQCGFQETDTVDIFKPVTKYAVLVKDSKYIKYELEKAVYIAKSGRPGPVLVDIPDDIQRGYVETDDLLSFDINNGTFKISNIDNYVAKTFNLLNTAERPLLVLGWGVILSGIAQEKIYEFINKLNIPVMVTWGTNSYIPDSIKQKIGTFGTHGTRHGNFAVQNSDFILAIGTRLDTHAVGSPFSSFARAAKKVFVDIDITELNKFEHFGMNVDEKIECDAKLFIENILINIELLNSPRKSKARIDWDLYLEKLRKCFPIPGKSIDVISNSVSVNPYYFINKLSSILDAGDCIVSDTGCGIAWLMQAFEFKENQQCFHAFNNTPMGYGLPAAMGAAFARDGKRVICVTGDAGLQMNIQELATVANFKLPIKIFILDNKGHGMVQQTQDQWFNSKYVGTSIEGGLPKLNFTKIFEAYGIVTLEMSDDSQLKEVLQKTLELEGPSACVININSKERVLPLCKFGRPIEDSEPLLDRVEFLKHMLVQPACESILEVVD